MAKRSKQVSWGMVVALPILVLGLIGLLVLPYVSFGIGFAILILEAAIVGPMVWWCIKSLHFQSLRRREEEALRRGDRYGAARARVEREIIERLDDL